MTFKAKIPEAWARMQWCEENFGDSLHRVTEGKHTSWQYRWRRDRGYLYFRFEKDYMLYLLVWS